MKKIMAVFGVRSDAIKMCPLIRELQRHDEFKTLVCVSGQHRELLHSVLNEFNVTLDIDLDIMKEGQSPAAVTAEVLTAMGGILRRERPAMVLVHGDTTTALAAALAAFYEGIPVGHVEAGLRSGDLDSPYPEEFNRRAISVISSLDFAPTAAAQDALLAEGKSPDAVFLTGNTVTDALRFTLGDEAWRARRSFGGSVGGSVRTLLLTLHRRENLGEPMRGMLRAVRRAVREHPDVEVIYPMHPNPEVRATAHECLDGAERIRLIEPLEVRELHRVLADSYLVLTDSGGLQEEAPTLGIPVLVLRDTTERPEGVECGCAELAGTDEDTVYAEICRLLDDRERYLSMSRTTDIYGDGHVSERIADILVEYLASKNT